MQKRTKKIWRLHYGDYVLAHRARGHHIHIERSIWRVKIDPTWPPRPDCLMSAVRSTYELDMRVSDNPNKWAVSGGPVGWSFLVRAVSGLSDSTYRKEARGPVEDALS